MIDPSRPKPVREPRKNDGRRNDRKKNNRPKEDPQEKMRRDLESLNDMFKVKASTGRDRDRKKK